MNIGEKIKRLRKERGLTQEELGNLLGVQKAAINKYETGVVVNLKRKTISKIADIFGTNPVWLMDDKCNWPPAPKDTRLMPDQQWTDGEQEASINPKNDEVRLLIRGLNKLSPEELEQATNVMKAMFTKYADYFEKGNDNDT